MAKLHDLGVAEAAKAIRAGDIKAEALALLARAAAHSSLNAFITLEPDKVRAAAREADRGSTPHPRRSGSRSAPKFRSPPGVNPSDLKNVDQGADHPVVQGA